MLEMCHILLLTCVRKYTLSHERRNIVNLSSSEQITEKYNFRQKNIKLIVLISIIKYDKSNTFLFCICRVGF